ncbi:MAG: tRNA (N(6)-L-threonylcarbamoyladenosine(37)-C(2))-methylthiotransferase MtaB [Bdellovibrionaceae bacterium]|nr:tRNA (N(6)-L-threonylcarbamoyladenosine(37)-C(2))-methylthiotransferase MtaB [Pseudobdellovibrionaceae bacterium]|tara:strand:- start:26924 stop:28258 length:1335 start_codon:yes stop_codon:yes gene_type:complete
MDKVSVNVETYGCKVNFYDTGLLQKRLIKNGFEADKKAANIHIINSCAVTAEATKEALRKIRKIKSESPDSTVVVTGCAAQVDTDKFQDNPHADLVVANSHKGQLEALLLKKLSGELQEKVFKSNIFKKEDLEAGGGREKDHTRSFLKIQDGCNSFCTFCVIPFARGKSRSVPIDDLVNRVNDLYGEGVREVVLTGVHIGDYEDTFFEKSRVLEDLIEQILVRTSMPRLRVSSLEPIELSERLLELFQDSALCPHFHMSIQSADSKVLKDMKRHYSADQVESALNWIHNKVKNPFVGMDVIAGFPGETEQEFQNTYDLLERSPWTKIHVFPYSERPGTFANRLQGKWDRSVIMERSKRLRSLSADRYSQRALDQMGLIKSAMLIRSKDERVQKAITHDFWNVSLPEQPIYSAGEIKTIKITGFDHSHPSRMEGCLVGEFVSENH